MKAARSAVVVPCYNESRRLQPAAFQDFLESSTATIIFVDDGSTDTTPEVLAGMQRTHSRVEVIRLSKNSGKAEAVRQGMNHALAAGYDFVGFWDADLATPLAYISDFENLLIRTQGLDMVLGARVRLLGSRIERKATRHYLGRVFAAAVSLTLRLRIYDSQCGAKLFRNGAWLKEVLERPFCSRWIFDVEILARYIAQLGGSAAAERRIHEMPLPEWRDVAGSKVRVRHFFLAFVDLVRIGKDFRLRTRSHRLDASAAEAPRRLT